MIVAPPSSESQSKHREGGVWQRRFWEHAIRDERDYENHVNYVHYNPVKHGLARCPHLWAASSFANWVKQGVYDSGWCCSCAGASIVPPYPDELPGSAGE
jgi:putative transposase